MKLNGRLGALVLLVLLAAASPAWGQAQDVIDFRGRLVDTSGKPIKTLTTVTVRLYYSPTTAVGTEVFSEVTNVTPDNDGYFSHHIGSVNLLSGVDFSQPIYVGLQAGSDPEISPRYLQTKSPYSFHADNALKLEGLSASAFAQLAAPQNNFAGDITATNAAMTGWVSAMGGFYGDLYGSATTFTGSLAGDVTGSMNNTQIANGAVTTQKLASQSVTTAKIEPQAITTSKLAPDAVTTGKIEAQAVTTAKIAPAAVTTSKLDAQAVTSAKLAPDAVTSAKIADGTITGADLDSAIDILTSGYITAAGFSGDGSGLTGLTAFQIAGLGDMALQNSSSVNITGGTISTSGSVTVGTNLSVMSGMTVFGGGFVWNSLANITASGSGAAATPTNPTRIVNIVTGAASGAEVRMAGSGTQGQVLVVMNKSTNPLVVNATATGSTTIPAGCSQTFISDFSVWYPTQSAPGFNPADFLPKDGSAPMTGDLDLGLNSLINATSVSANIFSAGDVANNGALRIWRAGASVPTFYLGAVGQSNELLVRDNATNPILLFESSTGALDVGNSATNGIINVKTAGSGSSIQLQGATGTVIANSFVGDGGALSNVDAASLGGVSAANYYTSAQVDAAVLNSIAALNLGTMSTQNSNSVAITGGLITSTVIGGSNPAAANFTTLTSAGTTLLNTTGSALTQIGHSGGGEVNILSGSSELKLEGVVRINRIGPNNTFIGNNTGGDVDITCSDSNRVDINAGNGQLNLIGHVLLHGTSGLVIASPYFNVDHQGNVSAASFSGDGSGLTGIQAGQVSGLGSMAQQDAHNVFITGGTISTTGQVTVGTDLSVMSGMTVFGGGFVWHSLANVVASGTGFSAAATNPTRIVNIVTGAGPGAEVQMGGSGTQGQVLVVMNKSSNPLVVNHTPTGPTTIPAGASQTFISDFGDWYPTRAAAGNADTLDGLDSSVFAQLSGSNVFTGSITATSFTGSGAGLTSLHAASLVGTLPALDGVALTNLNASNVTTGTLSDDRLSGNIVRRNVNNWFQTSQSITGQLTTSAGAWFNGDVRVAPSGGSNPSLYVAAAGGKTGAAGLFICDTNSTGPAGSFIITNSPGNNAPMIHGDNITGAGDLLRLLKAGSPEFVVSNNGNVTANGDVAVAGSLTSARLSVDGDTLDVNPTSRRVGIGTSAPTGKLEVSASGEAALVVNGRQEFSGADARFSLPRHASDPTADLAEGMVYFNTSTNKLRVYQSGAWSDVAPGSSGSGLPTGSIVFGETPNDSNLLGAGLVRLPSADFTSDSKAPDARVDFSAVWTGTEMIVWGGYGPAAVFNTGGRYNPSTNTWLPVSTVNAPSPRARHSAVWTGFAMMIWGGTNTQGTYYNDGYFYDPGNDTWQQLPSFGAPTPRHMAFAQMTSNGVMIWGGGDASAALNTGAMFDFNFYGWTPMSTVNAPVPRSWPGIAWTGSKLIVWSGGVPGGFVNTGAVWDLATDTWTAMTTANSPAPRRESRAVWTGTEMIVWGGVTNMPVVSGGRYNPATDTWSALPTAGAPLAYEGHTMIWTGTEAIVWGGLGGARYNPVTDSWSPIGHTNEPPSTVSHQTVWTGTHMVAWGGAVSGQYVATGGRYDPVADSWQQTTTGKLYGYRKP
jgi:hypothetical protein